MSATDPDLNLILETAVEAARRGGRLLRQGFEQPKQIKYKGAVDLVTQYDLASEKAVVDCLLSAWPGHVVLAEEGGERGQGSPYRWYVDPLDGTVNFAHGFPCFCVSIAFEADARTGPELMAGVIFDPMSGELYTAVRGQGAFLNGDRIRVSDQDDLDRALLATGFPYDLRERPDRILERFNRMTLASQGVRRPGAAALDMAFLAAGRVEGFWEQGLKPWDTAAGVVLIEEAGGRVTEFGGSPFRPQSEEILASNGHLHYTMMQILDLDQ